MELKVKSRSKSIATNAGQEEGLGVEDFFPPQWGLHDVAYWNAQTTRYVSMSTAAGYMYVPFLLLFLMMMGGLSCLGLYSVLRYLLRPRPGIMQWMRRFFSGSLFRYPPLSSWSADTHPPPSEAICIHIPSLPPQESTSGGRESRSSPAFFSQYMTKAMDLIKHHKVSPQIFLITEEEGLINEIQKGLYDDLLSLGGASSSHGAVSIYYL